MPRSSPTAAPRSHRVKDPTKKSNLSAAKKGKKFESNLLPKIKNWCERVDAQFARFYDAHSAVGSKLPAQISDCHITFRSIGHYVEVKFVEGQYFSCNKLKDRQFEGMLESLKKGFNYWLLIYSEALETYYLLTPPILLSACGGTRIVRTAEWDLSEVFADTAFHKYRDALGIIEKTISIHDTDAVLRKRDSSH